MMAETKWKLVYVDGGEPSQSQKGRIKELQAECFNRISQKELAECFLVKVFGWVFACPHLF